MSDKKWMLQDNGRSFSIPEADIQWGHSHSTDPIDNDRIRESRAHEWHNAEELVRRWNAFEPMVEALKLSRQYMFNSGFKESRLGSKREVFEAFEAVEAALKLAGEKL